MIAAVAAGVTIAQAFGVPVAESIPDDAIALFDAVAAVLVWRVPNA